MFNIKCNVLNLTINTEFLKLNIWHLILNINTFYFYNIYTLEVLQV